jgi:polysaccharide biosynthesis protein PelF
VVLSSISEALPLVLLEGYAAGVPAVSTDVGSCRQLIEGLTSGDKTLGKSGEIVGIANPQELADAILLFFTDLDKWHKASEAGIARVNKYYTHPLMFSRYAKVYDRALEGERADVPGFDGWSSLDGG